MALVLFQFGHKANDVLGIFKSLSESSRRSTGSYIFDEVSEALTVVVTVSALRFQQKSQKTLQVAVSGKT